MFFIWEIPEMTFSNPTPALKEKIGLVQVMISDADGSSIMRHVEGQIHIEAQDGRPAGNWNGDLLPHMPAQHKAALTAFLDWLRLEANLRLLE
jgi:hypothetical protein